MGVERLGRFELVSHLASGGMAKVFLARVAGLAGFERHVVLKTLRKEDIPDESYVGMFLDEARLAASLHHQNVAQVYDVGCTTDTYYLAMEYIHGKSVRSILETVEERRIWMPLDFALSVVSASAAGLHHAHERCRSDGTPLHIVHRDVSPSNVLASYDGSIKLIDFGIAKAVARVTQTRTGFIKGKAGYMAPEQARGYPVDRRSDVFSLGVLAYELTTLHRAFDAATEFERVEKIVHGDIIPPSHWVPDYPPELEEVILTALALDPDERYQDAEEMRLAIEGVAKRESLTLGTAPVVRFLAMLYGQPREPWIAPPKKVAKGSGTHDSLSFIPDFAPEPVDESSDITKPLDRELTEAEVIVDDIADRLAASTLSLKPRAGTIKPLPPPLPRPVPPPIPVIVAPEKSETIVDEPPPAPAPIVLPVTIAPRKARRDAAIKRQVITVIACGLALGLAIGLTITLLGHDEPATAAPAPVVVTPPPAPAPAPKPAPPPLVAPAADPPPPATSVAIHVTSEPTGATVVLDGVRLGTTPYTGTVDLVDRQGVLKVRMRGHNAVKTKVDRSTDIRWDVRLKRR